ncbi:MAG: hypothetical protein ACYTFN_23550, partial [Planctomycetota bacterium]
MKRRLILLVVLITLGIGGYLFVQGELPFLGDANGPRADGSTQEAGTGTETRPGVRQPVGPGERDPEEATLRYRVVDARTGEGIPQARILRLKDGSRVAETDTHGY